MPVGSATGVPASHVQNGAMSNQASPVTPRLVQFWLISTLRWFCWSLVHSKPRSRENSSLRYWSARAPWRRHRSGTGTVLSVPACAALASRWYGTGKKSEWSLIVQ
jgi:hypothetical protein